ncbi:MAG: hypothetical protein ABI082_12635 [Dokdonella sp.]
MAMPLTALAVVLGHVAVFDGANTADEGASAHIWQILVAGQHPFVVFFAITWLPQVPRIAVRVFGFQAVAFVAALAPVSFLGL